MNTFDLLKVPQRLCECRMMMNLKRAGIFKGCKAVLVGGMSDMNDNAIPFGSSAKETILRTLSDYSIPIVFGVPSGHIKRNLALIMNQEIKLSIKEGTAKLTFHGRS